MVQLIIFMNMIKLMIIELIGNWGNSGKIYEYVDGQIIQTHTFHTAEPVAAGLYVYYVDDVEVTPADYNKMTATVFEKDPPASYEIQSVYIWLDLIPMVREKHNIISELAMANNDEDFADTDITLTQGTSDSGRTYFATTANKYNKTFVVSSALDPEVSADGKTIKGDSVPSAGTGYFTIVNDELVCVGLDTYDEDYIISAEDYDALEMGSYQMFLSDKAVSEDEFNATINELMTRQ